jgi:hypothetical protein
VLQPGEVGEIEITVDTRRFKGQKSRNYYLTMQSLDTKVETYFTITADAQDDPAAVHFLQRLWTKLIK